ncbi:hypothetical protein ACEUZ9_002826 [Paracoccus litorisediminis]|uniref:hypothetical protein n=1 Tax=Paracoccus litorisediminis TaxID=2006130 RepID=UPI00372FF398
MDRPWSTAIGALSAVAVLAGLALVGGPGHARMQKRDAQKEQDLAQMADWIDCLTQVQGELPRYLAPVEQCKWSLRSKDPVTQIPYRYEITGPRSFRVCAEFELPPQRPLDRWSRNQDGCIAREFTPREPPRRD